MSKKEVIGILLGGGITKKGKISADALTRAKVALKLLQKKEIQKLVLSGGFSNKKFPRLSEARLFTRFFIKKGIGKKKLILEEKSKDTLGNAIYCKKLFIKEKLPKKIILITSNYHLQRSLKVFQHIFGNEHGFIGKKSKPFILHKIQNQLEEMESSGLDDLFLSQFKSGDHKKAERLLIKELPIYWKKKN